MMNASRHWARTSALEILSVIFLLLVSCFWGRPEPADATTQINVPLIQRVLHSEIIVVGKLINVKEDAIVIHHEQYQARRPKFHVHLDTGEMLVTKVLYKSHPPYKPKSSNLPTDPLPVAFHSKDQLQPNGQKVWVSSYRHFEEGTEGIWFLKFAPFTEHFAVTPNNLPVDSLQAVEKAIEKAIQIMNDIQE